MKLTDLRSNFDAAKGVWLKLKIDFYAKCKIKYDLTDAQIAEIMGISEQSVKAFSKMVVIKEK